MACKPEKSISRFHRASEHGMHFFLDTSLSGDVKVQSDSLGHKNLFRFFFSFS